MRCKHNVHIVDCFICTPEPRDELKRERAKREILEKERVAYRTLEAIAGDCAEKAALHDEIEALEAKLAKAVQFLREGKAKFTPNTTNSFVDDFLADYEALEQARKGDG